VIKLKLYQNAQVLFQKLQDVWQCYY